MLSYMSASKIFFIVGRKSWMYLLSLLAIFEWLSLLAAFERLSLLAVFEGLGLLAVFEKLRMFSEVHDNT